MNYYDIIVGIILLIAAFKGFKRGLVFELISIVGLILAIYGAFKFSNLAEAFIIEHTNNIEQFIPLLSFIIVFIIIILAITLIGKLINKFVKFTGLGIFNKLLGLAFGGLKAALIIGVLTALLLRFEPAVNIIGDDTKENSVLYSPLMALLQTCKPIIQDFYYEFKDNIKPAEDKNSVKA